MKYLILLLAFTAAQTGFSQSYFYLEEIKLKKKSDFTDNEGNVIKAALYLINTPFNEQNNDRKACTRFILRYAEKTPFVTVSVTPAVTKLMESNSEIITMYFAFWLKAAIENPDIDSEAVEKIVFKNMYKYTKAGNNVKRTDAINGLIKAGEENKLDDWLEKASAGTGKKK